MYFCEKLLDAAASSFISCSTSVFISADIISYNFLALYFALTEKDFCRKFSFFNRFTQTPQPLNDQNLLSVAKVFCQFSLKCLLKYFFDKFVDIILQNHLLCISSDLLPYIFFKGYYYKFSGLLFRISEYISKTAVLTQASVTTCK